MINEVNIKYQSVKSGIVEREKMVQYKSDAHMADIIRFLKDSIPKVQINFKGNLGRKHCIREFKSPPGF